MTPAPTRDQTIHDAFVSWPQLDESSRHNFLEWLVATDGEESKSRFCFAVFAVKSVGVPIGREELAQLPQRIQEDGSKWQAWAFVGAAHEALHLSFGLMVADLVFKNQGAGFERIKERLTRDFADGLSMLRSVAIEKLEAAAARGTLTDQPLTALRSFLPDYDWVQLEKMREQGRSLRSSSIAQEKETERLERARRKREMEAQHFRREIQTCLRSGHTEKFVSLANSEKALDEEAPKEIACRLLLAEARKWSTGTDSSWVVITEWIRVADHLLSCQGSSEFLPAWQSLRRAILNHQFAVAIEEGIPWPVVLSFWEKCTRSIGPELAESTERVSRTLERVVSSQGDIVLGLEIESEIRAWLGGEREKGNPFVEVLKSTGVRLAKDLLPNALERSLARKEWPEFDAHLARAQYDFQKRQEWLKRKADAVSQCMEGLLPLDPEQARILASPARTIRVTARAGSGKTRLLTALTYFLVDGYGYAPNEVLLLAFNRDAAGQIEDRLTKLLKIRAFPGARTFHSLAYGVAAPEEAVLFDKGESVAGRELTGLVQDILVGRLDDKLLDDVYALFRQETAEARGTGAFLQGADAYDFRRSLTLYTLGGQAVKSRGEKFIGDFLFEHGIPFAYERATQWERGWYRPDFTIKVAEKTWIIWEHWAVDPEASLVEASAEWPEQKLRDYQAAARRKREFWAAKKVPLLESCAQGCGDREAFEAEIAAKLRPFFPLLEKLPKAQLAERMKTIHLSRLSGWVAQAIQRAQKRGWDAAGLNIALAQHVPESDRERLFLALVEQVFAAYEPRLEREKKTDFDRLFNRAIELMRAPNPQTILGGKQSAIDLRRLRFCLVDEAQDLSPQFIEAVACLRELNPRLRLMFVGDDWQAINRFAGSEVELFTKTITTRFGQCATPSLVTNYRSVRKVVLAGNALMRGQGDEANPHKVVTGTIQLAYLDQVWVEGRKDAAGWAADAPFRECGVGAEKLLKALYQLAILDLVAGKTVGVLFRTNQFSGQKLPDLAKGFVQLLRRMGWPRDEVAMWQKERIRFSTAHSFKGAERQTVFVVNPYAGNFPLLNADSLELFRFFGDNLEQAELDERRLFYVAITRAEERLVFLSESRREEDSPYLESFRELIEIIPVSNALITPTGRDVDVASAAKSAVDEGTAFDDAPIEFSNIDDPA